MSILDLSKLLMYEFHYDCIKSKYGHKSKLMFTNTDNLMYKIKTKVVYEDFNSDKSKYDDSNKSVIVKMVD